MRRVLRVLSIAAVVTGCTSVLAQDHTPVHLLASNGVKALMEELQPQAERAIGHPITIEFNSTAALRAKMETGAAFDATILTTEAIDDLIRKGQIDAATRADLARCGIGLGIRSGASKPDIGTVDSLKQALLKAKSITYARDGASSPYLVQMFERLGIAGDLRPKITLAQGSIAATASVRDGKAEIVLTLISEIVPVRGIELAGPLPAGLQSYVRFAGGVSAKSNSRDAAQALVRFLAQPSLAQAYRAKGLEPR